MPPPPGTDPLPKARLLRVKSVYLVWSKSRSKETESYKTAAILVIQVFFIKHNHKPSTCFWESAQGYVKRHSRYHYIVSVSVS